MSTKHALGSVSLDQRRVRSRRWLVPVIVGGLAALVILGLVLPATGRGALQPVLSFGGIGPLLALALPAYLAGVFSLLSPCCLPILPAYFSVTFGAQRHRVVAMSLTFFLGLATTMVVLGASFSALGALIFPYREVVTQLGGFAIIGFGVMSTLGKGFSGLQMRDRPTATLAGTYVYGLTFAFGWTACVGPILGAILTALITTGLSVLSGALLAFIYALGLATPLTLLATFFGRVGRGTRVGNFLRGRGYSLHLWGRTLHVHTTSLISGTMLILVGTLLASGQLSVFTQQMASGAGTRFALAVESWLARVFQLGW
ncbi:MAG: cytochrome c biogenesis protein CcdA [Chloroflexota bacterium]|nr:cytochrome c biogenesis protein CcdA [Chloroflexota bacterium]